MKRIPASILALMLAAAAGLALAAEPVLGPPCDGCDIAFRGMPENPPADSRIAPPGEPGEPLVLDGIVRRADGTPAEGIIVYGYHTNAKGRYPGRDSRHGELRGWAKTGADGRYRFETIRPGAYPGRTDPQHIHLQIIEPGRGTYYLDDVVFEDDSRLVGRHRHDRSNRGGSGIVTPRRDPNGTWHATRDITLGANIPGY